MPITFFGTREKERFVKTITKQIIKKGENIMPTPFAINPEYVDKHITIKFNNDSKETQFNSTAKQIKLGNYCICMQSISNVIPIWNSKSQYSSLIIFYIIKNLQLYGNYVEITEQDFINWAGCKRDSFYKGLKALLRPEVPHPCAGDNMALLAATNRKSIYIVNHNFIFRGNYDEFVTMYEQIWTDGCKLDSRGRVILPR